MRATIHLDTPLRQGYPEHEHGRELAEIDRILQENLQVLDLVHQDLLSHGADANKGREAMTADQVLRVTIIKQMEGYTYRELTFHLVDSMSYQTFSRIGVFGKSWKRSTLNENIKRLRPETLEAINRAIVDTARAEGVEKGRKVRVDCAVTETNIHHPTDSGLLWDVVRVLTRLMYGIPADFGVVFGDHTRRAKRRAFGISNAKKKSLLVKLYRDLVKVTTKTVGYAVGALKVLDAWPEADFERHVVAKEMAATIRDVLGVSQQVITQTRRRVLQGELVPVQDKIVSIFERHTDIIKKKGRETLFGHKVCFTVGASSLTLDCVITEGNPSDTSLAPEMIKRQKVIYGRAPLKTAFDGAFASKLNLEVIKDLGVRDVAFNKKRGLKVHDMVKSTWVYKNLTRFRAGIEGCLSFLIRCFGLDRCTWRTFGSFKSYVWASIVSANLLILARHRMAAARPG